MGGDLSARVDYWRLLHTKGELFVVSLYAIEISTLLSKKEIKTTLKRYFLRSQTAVRRNYAACFENFSSRNFSLHWGVF